MKVAGLTISITDVQNALSLDQNAMVSAIFSHAEEVIENGGEIIIQQEYENAEPVVPLRCVRFWSRAVLEYMMLLFLM